MSYFMVDVEADGPIPGEYSMVCLGIVIVDPLLNRTFYGRIKPISKLLHPPLESLKDEAETGTTGLQFQLGKPSGLWNIK